MDGETGRWGDEEIGSQAVVLWSKLQDLALLAFRATYEEPPVTQTWIQPSGQTASDPARTAL